MVKVKLGLRIVAVRHRLQFVDQQRVARDLPEAHLSGTRIDIAHHTATVAGISHEDHPRSAQFELPDEMVELAAQNTLNGPGWRNFKAWQQEHVLHPVRLRAFDALRLLGAVTGDRQKDEVVVLGPLQEPGQGRAHDRPGRAKEDGGLHRLQQELAVGVGGC